MDEHRVLMGTVIEKVQSAKSGLNEACGNLLIGFEVSDMAYLCAHPALSLHYLDVVNCTIVVRPAT